MILVLSPVQQLFFGVSIVALIMIATVVFMVSSDSFENNDRLMKFLKK